MNIIEEVVLMKGLLLLHHGCEDVEALATRGLLKRSGLDIDTATFEDTLEIKTSFGLRVKSDAFAKDLSSDDYDFLVIPGGPYVARNVDEDTEIKALATDFTEQGKLVAAICAGPRFLGQAGLLDGKTYTAFTGSDKDAPKGHYHPEKKAITDGSLITARGAGAVYEFAYHIVAYLKGDDAADELLESILH